MYIVFFQEGEDLIKNILSEASAWDLDNISDDDLCKAITHLKSNVMEKENAYVQHLMVTIS